MSIDHLPLEGKTIRTPPAPRRPVTDKPPTTPTPPPSEPAPSPAPIEEPPAPPPPPEPPSALAKVPVPMGMAPRTLEEGWRMATMLAKSELVPKNFRHKPEDIIVAMQMGMEVGLAPMQSLQSIAVINGRPSIWGDGFLALIVASPLYQDHDEYYEVEGHRFAGVTAADLAKDDTAAVCTFWRRDKPVPITRRFTVAAAKKAGLLGKEGPWQSYPDRMLAMRARSWAGRDGFADLLRGIRTAEEALDEQEPTPRIVQRISETPAEVIPAAVKTSRGGAVMSDDQEPF